MSVSSVNNQAYVGAANTVFGQSAFKVQGFNDLIKPERSEAYRPNGSRVSDKRIDAFLKAAKDPSSIVAKHLGK